MKSDRQYPELYTRLKKFFGEATVKSEWDVIKDSQDDYDRKHIYGPRVDFAIGPFNINRQDKDEQINEIHKKFTNISGFIAKSKLKSEFKLEFNYNRNPRCLMAIEVESDNTSYKHRLGSLFNVSFLGKVGIAVGNNPDATNALLRLYRYVQRARTLEKIPTAPTNVIILRLDELNDILKEEKA